MKIYIINICISNNIFYRKNKINDFILMLRNSLFLTVTILAQETYIYYGYVRR